MDFPLPAQADELKEFGQKYTKIMKKFAGTIGWTKLEHCDLDPDLLVKKFGDIMASDRILVQLTHANRKSIQALPQPTEYKMQLSYLKWNDKRPSRRFRRFVGGCEFDKES